MLGDELARRFRMTTAPHMQNVDRAEVLRLWALLADGRIAEIDQEPWLPGDG